MLDLNFVAPFVRYCYKCNSLFELNMESIGKKRQQNRKFHKQLDDFDQNVIIDKAVSSRRQKLWSVAIQSTGNSPLVLMSVILQRMRAKRKFRRWKIATPIGLLDKSVLSLKR